ncbi:membrane protein [Virgibacillus indicus]|uniref:UPF0182 protein CIL03_05340 n=1 Tax=Virgibacillus indicus TaxID=2024554 RepID=A0A265NET8_9BACI|nr:UPF0182 family protein [Virgibacillus indicus]OZU90570.1 membrane protein [Virgibacillus indicus]
MDYKDYSNKLSPEQLRKLKKIGKIAGTIFGVLIVLAIIFLLSLNWITDYIWMDSLGFETVYTTILGSKVMLGLIGFLLFFILTYITLAWIRKSYFSHFHSNQLPPLIENRKSSRLIMMGGALFTGLIGSSIVQGVGWEPFLKLTNYASFGQTDPHFNMDISFYLFVLPFVEFIIYLLLGLAIFFLVLEIGAYSVFNIYRMSRSAQLHMGVTLGIVGLLLAGTHLLAPFKTLLSNQVNIFQESVVYGLSYTDNLINIPAAYVLAAAAVIGTIWLIILLTRGNINAMATPFIAYIVLVVLAQGASVIVQNFIVSPNEFSREEPYLEHNLNFTRAAYDLDNIDENEHPGNNSLDKAMLDRNQLTIDNVRINDSRPIMDVYNQLQTFRTYYEFNDIDIDRYEIDGEYEQVFIGARELSTVDLPSQAQTWVNQNLRYTHGYGVAMSHVNKITSQGQPEYMLRNVPPEGVLDVTRPQIYFGEEPYDSVIVNSEVDEFDYPSGDENMTSRFEEDAGIPLTGINRLLFAINDGSFRMFVSDQINSDSKLLETRNIVERVERIAPFFQYDEDPYIFVRDDGSLAWIIDAYLTAENYPYAEAHRGQENYIRNSVKVVIDAYTGDTTFYTVDSEDPLMQTYQGMFPDLFTEEVPEDVQAHFRYPEMLFKIQAAMYGTYHMSNLEIFYNREDFWQFPTEKYFNEDTEVEPYYITMKLPESDQEEFILMTPYTPKNRQNMIAWMGVRNDGEHYGEKFVYRFPKQKNIYGPQQIENRINQDSNISQQLNLWSQGGSEVIRGNLLAIPIEDTVMYVEPIYIESSNETSLPEVKQIILAYEDHIVMEETFDKALDSMLQLIDPENVADEPEQEEKTEEGTDQEEEPEPLMGAEEMLREISEMFDAYQEEASQGNWQEAGKIMEEIESRLGEIETEE